MAELGEVTLWDFRDKVGKGKVACALFAGILELESCASLQAV